MITGDKEAGGGREEGSEQAGWLAGWLGWEGHEGREGRG